MSLEIYEAIFENDSKPLGMMDVDVKTFFEVIESRNGDLLKHEIISLMISKLQSLKKDNIPTMLYVLSNAVVLGMLDFQEINELFEDSTNHVELKKYDIDLLNARVDRFGFWELRLFHEFTPNLNIKSIQMEHLSARRIINKYWDRLLQAIKDF